MWSFDVLIFIWRFGDFPGLIDSNSAQNTHVLQIIVFLLYFVIGLINALSLFFAAGYQDVSAGDHSVHAVLGTYSNRPGAGGLWPREQRPPGETLPQAPASGHRPPILRQQLCQSHRLRLHVKKLSRKFPTSSLQLRAWQSVRPCSSLQPADGVLVHGHH